MCFGGRQTLNFATKIDRRMWKWNEIGFFFFKKIAQKLDPFSTSLNNAKNKNNYENSFFITSIAKSNKCSFTFVTQVINTRELLLLKVNDLEKSLRFRWKEYK